MTIMKKILNYIFIIPMLICVTGCLDENPRDQLDQDAIYDNASNIYNNAVASLYNYFG